MVRDVQTYDAKEDKEAGVEEVGDAEGKAEDDAEHAGPAALACQ